MAQMRNSCSQREDVTVKTNVARKASYGQIIDERFGSEGSCSYDAVQVDDAGAAAMQPANGNHGQDRAMHLLLKHLSILIFTISTLVSGANCP